MKCVIFTAVIVFRYVPLGCRYQLYTKAKKALVLVLCAWSWI